jgi:hypothetical protein
MAKLDRFERLEEIGHSPCVSSNPGQLGRVACRTPYGELENREMAEAFRLGSERPTAEQPRRYRVGRIVIGLLENLVARESRANQDCRIGRDHIGGSDEP